MKRKTHPPKIENVAAKAKQCVVTGYYRYTAHAEIRKYERNITEEDALFVIENGWRVPNRDDFCDIHQSWKYAFEGKTLQEELLRVIIGFDENMLLIVTVINILKSDKSVYG
jgi:Domain of unknown function (DUF4258)